MSLPLNIGYIYIHLCIPVGKSKTDIQLRVTIKSLCQFHANMLTENSFQ